MNGNEYMNGAELNADGRLPVPHPEIGQADFANVIDFGVDSDDEFDFLDDADSDDEMELLQIVPYQAAQFLVDAAEEQQIVEIPGHIYDIGPGDEDAAQELDAQSNDEGNEAPGNLPEVVCDNVAVEDAEPIEVEASTDENEAPMEVVEGIESEAGIELDDQELVEHQVLELAGELVEKVEEQESVPSGNQLAQEQNPVQHDSSHTLVEDQDQELNISSASGQDQERNEGLSASGHDQELNKSSSVSGQDQERNGDSSASGHDQELNEGSSNTRRDQEEEINGSSFSGEDPIEEQVRRGALADCEEAMERLEIQPDIQVPPICGVEVQENIADQIQCLQDVEESPREKIVLEELNGGPDSGEFPEDQQEKVIQIYANEEAGLVPEPVQEQVEEDIEADVNADLVPEEQDNLVEEIVHEEQVALALEPEEAIAQDNAIRQGELAGAIEEPDNVVKEDDNAEEPFDPFIHMPW